MIDLGSGIAIAGVAIAAAPVAITAIRARKNGNGNGNGYSKALCDERHKSIEDKLARQETDRKEILSYLQRIETKIDSHITQED